VKCVELLCGYAKSNLLSSILESEYEEILKFGIEVKVGSEKYLAKNAAVAFGDDTYF